MAKRTLRKYWGAHANAKAPLEAWYGTARKVTWQSFQDVRNTFGSADWIGNDRVVFNIGGNNYRLIVRFDFTGKIAFIRFIGTHAEYDKLADASLV